jgi:hypothetical protein
MDRNYSRYYGMIFKLRNAAVKYIYIWRSIYVTWSKVGKTLGIQMGKGMNGWSGCVEMQMMANGQW